MDDEKMSKYNEKRKEILSEYRNKKIKSVFLTLLVGTLAIATVWILFFVHLFNIAVTLVLTAVFVMISVIFARIKVVTVNHVRDERLRLFEDSDPKFY